MQSRAKEHFSGYSVAFESDRLLESRLKLYLSYAYTRARLIEYSVNIPYDLSAPHRLISQVDYRITRRLTAGTEVQMHTGYPYSPTRWMDFFESLNYNSRYFVSQLGQENSLRFTTNFTLNLYASYQFGRGEIFAALTNVTNRANELVSAGHDMVTDPGILPSVGFRLTF